MNQMNTQRSIISALLTLLMVAGILVFGTPVAAQETTGNITGVVKDSSGGVLPEVTVTLTNRSTNRTLRFNTTGEGLFLARDVAPGHYSVVYEKAGFAKAEIADVQVFLGKTARADMLMSVGTVATTVEISAAAPLIDTSSTLVAHNVTTEELDRMPKGRSFQGIALLSPSVNTGQVEGGYQINGASAAENNYYVDGISTNSQIDGSARQNAQTEFIQEVQVKTAGLEAEYGGALGGVVTAVTKSGGNAFHGEAHYYYYGNRISAASPQRLTIDPSSLTAAQNFQDSKYKTDNNEFGGSLGGPILKDKIFFFSSISPRYLRQSNDYMFDNGKTPGTMERKAYWQNWFNKLSLEPSRRVRANLTWLWTPTRLTGSMFAYDGYGPNYSTSSLQTAQGQASRGYHQPESNYSGNVDFMLTDTTLLNVRGGRYYLDYKEVGIPYTYSTWWQGSSVGLAGWPTDLQRPYNYSTPSAAQVFWDITTRTNGEAQLSQVVRALGTHNFKFGIGTQKNVNNVNNSQLGKLGRIEIFPNAKCSSSNCVAPFTGTYGYYIVQDYAIAGTTGANINHIFVQDSWRIFSRLTLNVGFRTETEAIPTFRRDIRDYAFQFGWGDKFAPRIGASFDVFGNGKVKISGGWGRFFDWTKYDLARGTFGAERWVDYYRTLDTLDISSLTLANMPGQNLWKSQYRDHRVPAFDSVDAGIKPMSVDNMNAGVEWEVKPQTVFTARYSRSKLNRTIEDIGYIDADGNEAYLYGNPGESVFKYGLVSGQTCSAKTPTGDCSFLMPTAQRVYDAMELSLSRRFSQGWFGNFSYVYSKLWGNYPGIQNTDEIRPPGASSFGGNQQFGNQSYRPGGNASRAFDLDEQMFDANGNVGVFGNLPTDRPHVFKFYGSKMFKFGTEVGGFFRVSSGTPISTTMFTANGVGMYVNGRGDLGRTPIFSQTDLLIAHEVKFGEVRRLRFEFNAQNLFNQKTEMFRYQNVNTEARYTSTGVDVSGADLSKGFNWQQMLNDLAAGDPTVKDPRFGKGVWFNPGFAGRVMVKFIF